MEALATAVNARGDGVHSPNAIAAALGVSTKTVQDDIAELATTSKLPEKRVGLDGKVRPARRPTVIPAKNVREAERAQDALAVLGDDAPARVLRATRDTARLGGQSRRTADAPSTARPAIRTAHRSSNPEDWSQLGRGGPPDRTGVALAGPPVEDEGLPGPPAAPG